MGDVAWVAVATARFGERPGAPLGSIVGVVEFCARAAPPCETCAVGLATLMLAEGCVRVAPAATQAYNPAFDVTPADLVAAVVTEARVVRPAAGERP